MVECPDHHVLHSRESSRQTSRSRDESRHKEDCRLHQRGAPAWRNGDSHAGDSAASRPTGAEWIEDRLMADGPITKWSARLREGHVFVAGPEGRSHIIDGDSKIAPGPVEVLLEAIMTCSAVDIVDILAKRRTPVEKFNIEVA